MLEIVKGNQAANSKHVPLQEYPSGRYAGFHFS